MYAPTASASTASNMESQILTWMNRDRVAAGLVAYRRDGKLAYVAGKRAARMASLRTLSHTAAGPNLGYQLSSYGVQWYDWGEAIGATSYPWGSKAAANLYSMWKASAPHRALMMSTGFNYIGIGVARASNGSTYASIVFTDSKDHTGAVGKNVSVSASGTTVSYAWTGADVRLQKRTAGLRSFDVQYRVDGGTWRTIRNDTTNRGLSLANRARGHWYGFRVQAADQRGNLGSWSREAKVWVP
ncbi:MAG TPA: CAP domain-containing protein [Candidatus Limnocylindrales bacterium]|nr:CAP domain-containing protein [Candidatus Limnocylindrales bacterium]